MQCNEKICITTGYITLIDCRFGLVHDVFFGKSMFAEWIFFSKSPSPLKTQFFALSPIAREGAWSSGLGRWNWNLEVPGSNPPPYYYLDLISVVPSSTPRPRCVNSQLVSLPPVGILNSLCYIYNICLFICSVPN